MCAYECSCTYLETIPVYVITTAIILPYADSILMDFFNKYILQLQVIFLSINVNNLSNSNKNLKFFLMLLLHLQYIYKCFIKM